MTADHYAVANAIITAGERLVWVAIATTLGTALLLLLIAEIRTWRHRGPQKPRRRSARRTLVGDLAALRAWARSHLTPRGRADAALERHLTTCLDERVREMTGATR